MRDCHSRLSFRSFKIGPISLASRRFYRQALHSPYLSGVIGSQFWLRVRWPIKKGRLRVAGGVSVSFGL